MWGKHCQDLPFQKGRVAAVNLLDVAIKLGAALTQAGPDWQTLQTSVNLSMTSWQSAVHELNNCRTWSRR